MTTVFLDPTIVLTAGLLVAVIVIAGATLRAWQGWLEFKRQELERSGGRAHAEEGSGLGTARIELADLKERIRKLEAIASGVEL
ncbi:hypothetical protein [Porphyrobacter sp. YT40]|uniref:hypothetical protein n=1 Tax=Porphyrobacter sp. YT40 TaxID=2547601 RepID=UPI0011420B31|nr:hypothetical protein [Porphyrobacter sp. YT40]QDH34242.1 hypothetical protein E2E27_07860 [Porphyrobacter sp. YT40]